MVLFQVSSVRVAFFILIWRDAAVYSEELNFNNTFTVNRIPRNTINSDSIDDVCGTVVIKPQPLIAYGQPTQPGEFPWHAALYYAKSNTLNYICGASLVSQYHIITAAHCVTREHTNLPLNFDNLIIYLGKYYFKRFSAPGIQELQVSDIIPHPQYNAQSFSNDIAVVQFESPAQITDYVRPVCLWQGSSNLTNVINKLGTVAGWGLDGTGKFTETIIKANMPVVLNERCIFSFPEFYGRYLSSKTFCAGFQNGTTVCSGDSGSGMVFLKPNSNSKNPIWQLRGVVSIRPAEKENLKCDSLLFAVFTDSVKYLDWIKKTMQKCSPVSGCRDAAIIETETETSSVTAELQTHIREESNSNKSHETNDGIYYPDDFFDQYKVWLTGDQNVDDICGTVSAGEDITEVFPWHAALYYSKGNNLQYLCGSSLISKYHVLTVAQCVTIGRSNVTPVDAANVVAEFGSGIGLRLSVQSRQASRIILHWKYNAHNYIDNIALVKLIFPVEITDYVRPVCLWQDSPDLSTVINKTGTVVGNESGIIENLMQTKLPVVSQEKCMFSNRYYTAEASNTTYCAGFRNGSFACNGNFGSGMVFPKPNSNPNHPRWQIRGLMAASVYLRGHPVPPCELLNYLVFTDVAKYLHWIWVQIRN